MHDQRSLAEFSLAQMSTASEEHKHAEVRGRHPSSIIGHLPIIIKKNSRKQNPVNLSMAYEITGWQYKGSK